MSFDLRPYQRLAIDACFNAWEDRGLRRIAIQLPTAAGKTVVFTRLIREAREHRGWGTTLVLAHREELIGQAAAKLRADDPELRVGVAMANRNEVDDVDVIVGSVQTLHRMKRLRQLPAIDLVIVDEAHHSCAASYVKILQHLGCYDSDGAWLLGVSATLERNDSKRLADVYEDVVFQLDLLDLVPEYLAEPKALAIDIKDLDLTGVRVQHGDLVDKDLAEALDRSGAYGAVAAAYRKYAADRPGIVFCPSIATAEKMAEVFREWDFAAECITSRTSKDDRRDILDRYRAQKTQVLTNCGVLTEGTDLPLTSCIVPRPTKSRTVHSQMVGRGLRLSPETGKTDCLVLYMNGDAGRHQLCTAADLTSYEVDEVKDGEGLKEARDRTAREPRKVRTRGSLSARQVDLMRRASGSPLRDGTGWWLLSPQTGTPFVKITDERGFESVLWVQDEGNSFALMWRSLANGQEVVLDYDLDYGEACALGRIEALEMSKMRAFIDPGSRWRRAPFEECKQGQINYALRLGIDVEDRPTKGQLSDRITVCTTGRLVDDLVSRASAAA